MKLWRLILVSLVVLLLLPAHDIITTNLTFTRDVSRVFSRRCAACHGAEASIPLTNYEQVRPWAVSIKEQVLSRQMPPWGAVKGFGHLSPDNGLTEEEMLLIAAWVVGGAPQGNLAFLPQSTSMNVLPAGKMPMKDTLVVTNRANVQSSIVVVGIRPIAKNTVESARIIVHFPNGHVEPLLWLLNYTPACPRAFQFAEAITLPPGASVESGSPLQFALEAKQ